MAQVGQGAMIDAGRAPLLFLDANVLLPQYLRAVFLDLADEGMVRVHWSGEVLAEVRRNLVGPRLRMAPGVVDKLFADMARAFPDALVRSDASFEARFAGKTDPKDVHVAAGALRLSEVLYNGRTVQLVTQNSRHLPASAFAGTAVQPTRPGVFLKDLLAARPTVADAMDTMLRRFQNPRMTRGELLNVLDMSNCRTFATALGKAWGLVPEG